MTRVIALCLLISSASLSAQQTKQTYENQLLSEIISDDWEGTLTYLDYSSGKRVPIPSNLKVKALKDGVYEFQYIYPDEPHANQLEKVKIDLENGTIEGRKISSKEVKDNTLIVQASKNGEDKGEPVVFYFTYEIGENEFIIRKDFQKSGSEERVMRNEYRWSK